MLRYFENLARALLYLPYKELSEIEQKVIQSIAEGTPVAEDANEKFTDQLTFGERFSDSTAAFIESWTFIIVFLVGIVVWMAVNSYFTSVVQTFDPYPYILLNLSLSTLAAFQAPIIMMSQNRQSNKDKMEATLNYEVSLKTDLEITRLHQKLDELLEMQKNTGIKA
ncbi:MAG: DUF1003 domain-containing protein [Nitrospirales bacterium]|nr:DUF1003 domain-containing protein [Nitrospirales bacterium]